MELSPQLSFPEAFAVWISHRVLEEQGLWTNARYIARRTEWDNRQYARALAKFLGTLPLAQIHAGHLAEYQRARAFCDRRVGAWERPAGANRIRKEVGLLVRVMKAAGAWTDELDRRWLPLKPVENDVPRAMSPEEQHRFLHTAATRMEWRVVYCWALASLQTTAATNEMRAMRIGDVNLAGGYVQVRREGAKNKFRVRTIPLVTPEVAWAFQQLLERAVTLGATGPHCYLFPFHLAQGRYDPERGMTASGIKKRWDEVRKASGVDWLRPYDLRHTGITRMAEAGVPIQVIMSFAGHMTMRMQLHYTTVSMMAKRRAAAAAWSGDVSLVGAAFGVQPAPADWPAKKGAARAESWAEYGVKTS